MGSKSKGGDFERNICKFLSFWIQGSEKPYLLWRQPASGGMATISEENIGLTGDIRSISPLSEFLTDRYNIECKNGYDEASLDKHLKYNKTDPLRDFWIQTTNDATKSNKYPMLVYRKKGLSTPWIGISTVNYNDLYDYLKSLRFIHLHWGMDDLIDTYLFEMKEFFSTITPDIIKGEINVKS
uniref:YqaJ viral recombinase domain-containing protein n=2 Tax=viral metagenome TaxID=1070528 RepID=A0A6M3JMK8_9ZZZZ